MGTPLETLFRQALEGGAGAEVSDPWNFYHPTFVFGVKSKGYEIVGSDGRHYPIEPQYALVNFETLLQKPEKLAELTSCLQIRNASF